MFAQMISFLFSSLDTKDPRLPSWMVGKCQLSCAWCDRLRACEPQIERNLSRLVQLKQLMHIQKKMCILYIHTSNRTLLTHQLHPSMRLGFETSDRGETQRDLKFATEKP